MGLLEQYEIPESGGKVVPTAKICGLGKIDGRTVVVHADDRTILAGSDETGPGLLIRGTSSLTAPGRRYPIISLGDGGGARIQDIMGSDNMSAAPSFSRGFTGSRQVPHIVTIMGDCFGASSWEAATADVVSMVKGTCMAVSGPRVLEVAKNEKVPPEELGGWKLHAEVIGQVDAFAEDDEHCLQIIREFIGYMASNCDEEPPYVPTEDPPDRRLDEVMDILPDKSNPVYDMYKIIKAIVDDGKYLSLKPYFGKALITCLARMNGRTVGIIASQTMYNAGAGGLDECEKATSFIVLCDSFNIPLVFLTDTPGFLVGKDAERRKMPLRIMVRLKALTLATVLKIFIIVRKSYGMAYNNMCGNICAPDLIVAWPTADISFMAPDVGVNVVWFRRLRQAENPEAEREKLIKQMEYGSAPWKAAAKGLLDDVIDPSDTRKYIIDSLNILRGCRDGSISKKYLQLWPTGFYKRRVF